MIGVSLPFLYLTDGGEPYGSRSVFYQRLLKAGVENIELRTVNADADPEKVLGAAVRLWDAGFQITVHGRARSCSTAVDDLFTPLSRLLPALRQKELIVVMHPTVGSDEELLSMLRALADHIRDEKLPVRIALENNRKMPDGTLGDSVALVSRLVNRLDRPEVGICFDMGHFYWFVRKDSTRRPPEEFLKRIIHTHIHALSGETTHFPLGRYDLPVREYIAAFSHEYGGCYHLELEYPRYAGLVKADEAILESIETLKRALPQYAFLYDDVRRHFCERLWEAGKVYESPNTVTAMGLIQSTSYLFSTNGFHWAMDIALRDGWRFSEAPAQLAQVLRSCRLMVITHGHRDHFERETVALLKELPMQWLIPDFLYEKALSFGLAPEKLLTIRAGEEKQIGPLTLTAFNGQHFRPDTGAGVEELGYRITAQNAPSLVFPCDVRDFSTDALPDFPEADAVFAHVWLGDKDSRDPDRGDYPALFARYMLSFHPKKVLYTHLYETARTDEQTWRYVHAGMAADAVRRIDPAVKTVIPGAGDVIVL